jgi:hypothetical protein
MLTILYLALGVLYSFTPMYRDKRSRGCGFKKRLGLTLQDNKSDLPGFTFSTYVGYPDYPYGSKARKHTTGCKYGSEDCGFRTL